MEEINVKFKSAKSTKSKKNANEIKNNDKDQGLNTESNEKLKLQNELNDFKIKEFENSQKLKILKRNEEFLQSEITRLYKLNDQIQIENQELKRMQIIQQEDFNKKNLTKEAEINELKDSLCFVVDLTVNGVKADELENESENLKLEINKLKADKVMMEENFKTVNAQTIQEFNSKIANMESENTALKNTIYQLKENLKANKSLENDVDDLKNKLNILKEEVKKKDENNNKLTKNIRNKATNMDELGKLKLELNELKAVSQKKSEELQLYSSKFIALESENKALKQTIQDRKDSSNQKSSVKDSPAAKAITKKNSTTLKNQSSAEADIKKYSPVVKTQQPQSLSQTQSEKPLCKVCGKEMLKKRGYYCVDKCKQPK